MNLSIEEVKTVVVKCYSYTAVLRALNYAINGTNNRRLRQFIIDHDIETMHFKINEQARVAQSLEFYLTTNSMIQSYGLKLKLLKAGILDPVCSLCGINEWLGETLALHLDHINGNRTDNRLENLRLLCPNCHSLTETYAGKKNKLPVHICLDCDKPISKYSIRCHKCNAQNGVRKANKIEWPTMDALLALVNEHNFSGAAKVLGVSDNAIRKRLRANGINPATIINGRTRGNRTQTVGRLSTASSTIEV